MEVELNSSARNKHVPEIERLNKTLEGTYLVSVHGTDPSI